MELSRLLTAALLLALLADLTSGQMYQNPDWLAEYIYHPMITCIVRIYEFCKNVKGGWKTFMGRRRRSLDSPAAGDLCDLRQPCLAMQAMDDGQLDQWVASRWPAAAGSWKTEPQLVQLFGQLSQLQREERPYSRRLRRRACRAVLDRCPDS